MKRNLISVLAVSMTLSSLAQAESRFPEPVTCVPTRSLTNPNNPLLTPDAVKQMLEKLRSDVPQQDLNQMIGEPVLKSLDAYSRLDSRGVNANYGAAVAAGVAVAVVDFVWDKYVGNGRDRLVAPKKYYFDREQSSVGNGEAPPSELGYPLGFRAAVFAGNQQGYIPKVTGVVTPVDPRAIPETYKGYPYSINPSDKEGISAVAVATAGAVAYKAAEWALNTAFGDSDKHRSGTFNPRQFDASPGRR